MTLRIFWLCGALVFVAWGWTAQATCMQISQECYVCCAPGGPCAGNCDDTTLAWQKLHPPPPPPRPPPPPPPPVEEPEDVLPYNGHMRIEMGAGYTKPLGQLERSVDGSVFSGRMLLGVGYREWSLGLALSGTNLQSDVVDLGLNDLWCQIFALSAGYDMIWWADGPRRVGHTLRLEAGWALLSGAEYDHHGPSVGIGWAMFYENAFDPRDPFRYRWWLDVGLSSPVLASDSLQRHINGDFVMVSTGFSGLMWGL